VAEIDEAGLVIALAPAGRTLQTAALLAGPGMRDVVEPP
jgi:hypothetical protein